MFTLAAREFFYRLLFFRLHAGINISFDRVNGKVVYDNNFAGCQHQTSGTKKVLSLFSHLIACNCRRRRTVKVSFLTLK